MADFLFIIQLIKNTLQSATLSTQLVKCTKMFFGKFLPLRWRISLAVMMETCIQCWPDEHIRWCWSVTNTNHSEHISIFLFHIYVIFRIEMEHYFVIICLINGVFNDKLKGEPFEETLLQLEQFNMNMKQKYRSIGIMDDFSNIVTNMISSLQEVQVRHNLEAIFGLLLTFLF